MLELARVPPIRRRIRRLWRRLEILLRIRRLTPGDGELRPSRSIRVDDAPRDTGGAFYRPSHRQQDPAVDPREPNGSESSATGNDHGWSGCTMSAGADALACATGGEIAPWGGDLRHRQGDLSGGTDLYDLRDAWRAYGETLTIRSGAGWSAVVAAHDRLEPIVIQGSGQVPGAGDFTGGHACAISPEPHSAGSWLFGDPLATGWQWIPPAQIRTWAEAWQGSIAFATGAAMSSSAPAPGPTPCPPCPPAEVHTPAMLEDLAERSAETALEIGADQLVQAWLEWLRAPRAGPADRWDVGGWGSLGDVLAATLDDDEPDPCADPAPPAAWARGLLFPVVDALEALTSPAAWGASSWRESTWRTDAPPVGRAGRSALPAWP